MWQNWINGILGLWLILIVFLGFSSTLTRILLIISGLAIAVFGFWAGAVSKPLPKNSEAEIKPLPKPGFGEPPNPDSVEKPDENQTLS